MLVYQRVYQVWGLSSLIATLGVWGVQIHPKLRPTNPTCRIQLHMLKHIHVRKTRTSQSHPFDSTFFFWWLQTQQFKPNLFSAGSPLLPATGTTGVLPAKELASSCVFAPGTRRIGTPGRPFADSGLCQLCQMGCPTEWLKKKIKPQLHTITSSEHGS